jgi:hypothetical protein
MMTLQQIARILGGEVSGRGVLAPGPNHGPIDRSLSVKMVRRAPDGFLVWSFAGDDPIVCKNYVRDRLGLLKWERNGKSNGHGKARTVAAVYDYVDEQGELLFQVVRFEPKGFSQRRPDGKGGWIWSLDGLRPVPYRLCELSEAIATEKTVFICEGEKAVHALLLLGVPATCSPGGAGKWRDEYCQHLTGADVVILPDNDEPGEQHCNAVAKSLASVAARVRVLRLRGLPPKGDPYDWVTAGGTAEQFWRRVETDAVEGNRSAVASKGRALISRCAAEIEPQPVEWLWPGRIARGKHTSIAGEPGTGKSQLAIQIMAAVTIGGEWPCGEGRAPLGSVIILSAEDGEADTIVPRLMAAGSDLSKVHIITAVRSDDGKGRRAFNLRADLDLLEAKIGEIGDVALVNIDPVSSYMGGTDSHKNAEVRGVLEPVGEMAERMRVAVLSITHFSKAGAGTTTKALHKFIGSIAFVGAPRAAFAVLEDPDDKDRRLFLHAKNNLAPPPQGLAFRLEQTIVGDPGKCIIASCVKWEREPVNITADAVLAADHGAVRKGDDAMDFLQQVLADGPVPVLEVNEQAEALGIAEKTLKRARSELKVRATKSEFSGGWTLSLPEGGQTTPKGVN